MTGRHIVIVGAGQAAAQAILTLRQKKFDGRITLVGEEDLPPYQRPPLSKKYLAGELDRERLFLRPLAFYEKNEVDLQLGVRAEELDPGRRRVRLNDGRSLDYDGLLLATGSRVRRLNIPGSDLPGIHYVRNVADVDSISEAFRPGNQLVVVGAGYIGLEVSAVAVSRGLQVTVLEAVDRVMARVVCPEVSQFYFDYHTRSGVDIRCGTTIGSFVGNGRVEAVSAASGELFPCDLAIVGIGIEPVVEPASSAGLTCENGIRVDEFARTGDKAIVAAGDCTNHPSLLYGRRVRLESVQNAIDQAKIAAASLLGEDQPYETVPWFWSDQYDLKLQIAGLSQDHDRVVMRGEPDSSGFAAFYLRDGKLQAVDAVNSPKDFMLGKRLIMRRAAPSLELLADPATDLAELLKR